MTLSSASSETRTIRAPSPPTRPSTRSLLRRNITPPPTSPPTIPLPPTPKEDDLPISLSPSLIAKSTVPVHAATVHLPIPLSATKPPKPKSSRSAIPFLSLPKLRSKAKPISDSLSTNAVILRHRGREIVHIRPPTPVPVRPGTPIGLSKHSKLPSIEGLGRSLRGRSKREKGTSSPLVKKSDSIKPFATPDPQCIESAHLRAKSDDLVAKMKKKSLPPIPSSPPTHSLHGTLSSQNGPPTVHLTPRRRPPTPFMQTKVRQPSTTISIPSFLDLDTGFDKENTFVIPLSESPHTPSSAAFPIGIGTPVLSLGSEIGGSIRSSEESLKSTAKTAFPEQQGLATIHRLLSSVWEEGCDPEVKAACQILSKFLPQPGVIAERKYALRTSQEKKLEHSLSVLDAAVYQDLDTAEILEAKRCLVMLAPVIQQRFATLPYHREVQRLRTERSQVKENRAMILHQLSTQEAEIKAAQARREAERNREIEEAALRRRKRREEKSRERKTYDTLRATLESRNRELRMLSMELEKETQRLMDVRRERDAKSLQGEQKIPRRIQIDGQRVDQSIIRL